MFRSLSAGVAALALMSGAAFAQDSTYYNRRTETVTTPFGSSQTTTITTSQTPAPSDDDVGVGAPPPQMAEVPPPPPGDYDQTTTTRRIGPDGMETERTDRYGRHQTFYDSNEELNARTTTTQTHTTYGPAPVDVPPYSERTTTTTTTEDGE